MSETFIIYNAVTKYMYSTPKVAEWKPCKLWPW